MSVVFQISSIEQQSRKSNQHIAVLSTAMHLSDENEYASTIDYKAEQTQTLLLTYISSAIFFT